MSAAEKQRRMTIEEFFAWHEQQEERYELISGVPVLKRQPVEVILKGDTRPTMMTGASLRHNKVSGNLFRALANQLAGADCDAYTNDAAVRTAAEQIRYPDIVIDCGTPPDDGYELQNPKLVGEILSPSTRRFDLTGKLNEYWHIDSLQHVLIVDPESRRAQLYTRGNAAVHTVRLYAEADDRIEIAELGISVRLGDIFAGLPVSDDPA
jgi:Uma2 family endonuclease